MRTCRAETNSPAVTWSSNTIEPCETRKAEPVKRINMQQTAQNIGDFEQIDHKTSRSICNAVGERLQQNMRPEAELPQPLRQLLDQLRRRDAELH
jgi:hypothetical protein